MSTHAGGRTKASAEPKPPAVSKNGKPLGRPPAAKGVHAAAARWQAEHPDAPAEVKPAAKAWQTKLTPIGTTAEEHLGPYGAPDARALQAFYGDHQLGAALARYSRSPEKLRGAAQAVNLPTTGSMAAIITRITAALTHDHYSANFAQTAAEKAAAKEAAAAAKQAKAAAAKQKADERAAKALARTQKAAARASKPASAKPARSQTPAQYAKKIAAAQEKVDTARQRFYALSEAVVRGALPGSTTAERDVARSAGYESGAARTAYEKARKALEKLQANAPT